MTFNAAACFLSQFDPKDRLLVAKTLPRHLMILPNSLETNSALIGRKNAAPLKKLSTNLPTTDATVKENVSRQELIKAPLQKAPRPTTLPTRGMSANRERRNGQVDWLTQKRLPSPGDSNSGHLSSPSDIFMILEGNPLSKDSPPCESPSYVTQSTTYKYPEKQEYQDQSVNEPENSSAKDLNPLPVPSKEGKKHIQSNAKRHVRKYPLIIPVNGIQRIVDKANHSKDNYQFEQKTAIGIVAPTILANKGTSSLSKLEEDVTDNHNLRLSEPNGNYENTRGDLPISGCNYQNVDHLNGNNAHLNLHNMVEDTASLHFETMVEAAVNKDQVLHTPDVTNSFYNFSIQKEHYHKSKEMVYDPQQLTGLYVNEDELRNLDIDKNFDKLIVPQENIILDQKKNQTNNAKVEKEKGERVMSEQMLEEIRIQTSNSVSCEDLLDFADKKPKGCERGVDSDEVRIMLKVLGQEVRFIYLQIISKHFKNC